MTRFPRSETASSGFTLVELLVVMLIIGILGGLLFSVSDRIFGKGDRSRAVSELLAITVALEAYRSRFGDYPDVVSSRQLFDALDGKLGPKANTLTPAFPPFLEAGQFSLGSDDAPELLDPWGNAYQYLYQASNGGNRSTSFILFSSGPDGKSTANGSGGGFENDDNLWPDD